MSLSGTVEQEKQKAKVEAKSTFLNRDVLLGTALFGALSPGMLLTLPAESRGIWMTGTHTFLHILAHAQKHDYVRAHTPFLIFSLFFSYFSGQTSPRAVATHMVVFALTFGLAKRYFDTKVGGTTDLRKIGNPPLSRP